MIENLTTMESGEHDDRSPALQRDLGRIQRRQILAWLASNGAAGCVVACGGVVSQHRTKGISSSAYLSNAQCQNAPQETEGPFPADGSQGVNRNVLTTSGIVRSDIRTSFGSSTAIAAGLPLALTMTLLNSKLGCEPLSGFVVYLWHCDRNGDYSLYARSLAQENYLRGVQIADAKGQVTFQTIIPACYFGRYPHIHSL
jgi:protocatechuate 3,4-dioxygenase beta subunit